MFNIGFPTTFSNIYIYIYIYIYILNFIELSLEGDIYVGFYFIIDIYFAQFTIVYNNFLLKKCQIFLVLYRRDCILLQVLDFLALSCKFGFSSWFSICCSDAKYAENMDLYFFLSTHFQYSISVAVGIYISDESINSYLVILISLQFSSFGFCFNSQR